MAGYAQRSPQGRSSSSISTYPTLGALTIFKGSGLLSMVFLLWINISNSYPGGTITTRESIVSLTSPRKLDVADDPSLRMKKTRIGANKAPLPSTSGIVTFVDHRKVEPTKNFPVEQYQPPRKQSQPINNSNRPDKSLPEWRETYNQACQDSASTKENALEIAHQIYQPSTAAANENKNTNNNKNVEPCQYAFLDFGANIGDSLGKFIDSGMENCLSKKNNGLKLLSPKYNLDTGTMDQFYEAENILVRYSRAILRKSGNLPEDYCYFGVEGNPVFTERLHKLEQQINAAAAKARPVKKAHFFTETVGAGVDGPTVLYLDTISTDKNFWGSSVLTQPKYVRESAERDNNGKPIGAPVDGVTLSTMVKRTVKPEKDAHLFIKIDIEGGEYAVLQEVHKSGILCDYVKKGVTVTMLLEKHAPQFKAANLDMGVWDSFMADLRKCGVMIQGDGMSTA